MVKLIERKVQIYAVNGDGILIRGTAEEIASIVGYTAIYVRYLARTGKYFCLAGRDCSISLVYLKEN